MALTFPNRPTSPSCYETCKQRPEQRLISRLTNVSATLPSSTNPTTTWPPHTHTLLHRNFCFPPGSSFLRHLPELTASYEKEDCPAWALASLRSPGMCCCHGHPKAQVPWKFLALPCVVTCQKVAGPGSPGGDGPCWDAGTCSTGSFGRTSGSCNSAVKETTFKAKPCPP